MSERLQAFLILVRTAHWSQPPKVWNGELRAALGDNLIRVGWGGILELTDAGRAALAEVHT